MSAGARHGVARYAELSECLRQAAQAGDIDAVTGALEARAEVLETLARAGAGSLSGAHLAEIERAELEARIALESLGAALRRELEDVRAAREAVARARIERAPRLLSRRV